MSRSCSRGEDPSDFFDPDHGLALVVPAVGADPVWLLRLVAVRAHAQARRLEVIVGAAAVAARLRMTAFGVGHALSLLRDLGGRARGFRRVRVGMLACAE